MEVNIQWFWLFYYVGLIVCIKIVYGRISGIKGAGDSKIQIFLKTPLSKNDADVSIVDHIVLYVCKVALLFDWFMLFASFVVFCIQNKMIFGI